MWQLVQKGGPIMWPLIITSIVALSVIIERGLFVWRQRRAARPGDMSELLACVRRGSLDQAMRIGLESPDPVAQVPAHGLLRRTKSLTNALIQAASDELARCGRGLTALETIVTLAPFLGLLGTVTGMIRAFGLMGAQELDAPVAITGGIAEALIATAFGLTIALVTLVPLNMLLSYRRRLKRRLEQAATELEIELSDSSSPVHAVTL